MSVAPVPPVAGELVDLLRPRGARGTTGQEILIGFWADVPGDESGLPWPADHCNPAMSAEERARVAEILDRAPFVMRYMGDAWDRLNPQRTCGGGERAAGGWVWPEGLSHYVLTYGLVLPSEMLEAVANHKPVRRPSFVSGW